MIHIWTTTAPDIRYVALRNMSELKGRQRPYDIDDFRQQIENGGHPNRTEVKADMPRWQMCTREFGGRRSHLLDDPRLLRIQEVSGLHERAPEDAHRSRSTACRRVTSFYATDHRVCSASDAACARAVTK